MNRINRCSYDNICDSNVTLLSLAEAVKRWTSDGQFLMTEVNSTDAYQSETPNIDIGSYSARIGKIDAALSGVMLSNEVKRGVTEPAATEPAATEPAASEPAASE